MGNTAALVDLLTERLDSRVVVTADRDGTGDAQAHVLTTTELQPLISTIAPLLPEVILPFLSDALDGLTDEERAKHQKIVVDKATELVLSETPAAIQWLIAGVVRSSVESVADKIFDYAQGIFGDGA